MNYEEFVSEDVERLYNAIFKHLEGKFFPFELSNEDAARIASEVSDHYWMILMDHFGIRDSAATEYEVEAVVEESSDDPDEDEEDSDPEDSDPEDSDKENFRKGT